MRACPHKGRITASELRRANEELRRVRNQGIGRRRGRGNLNGRGRPQPRSPDLVHQLDQDNTGGGRMPRRGRGRFAAQDNSAVNALAELLMAAIHVDGKDAPGPASGN